MSDDPLKVAYNRIGPIGEVTFCGLSLTGVLNLARAEGYTRCRWAVRKGSVWTVGVLK